MFNITFGGVSLPTYVKVRGVDISALPSISNNLVGTSGMDGALDGGTSLGEKIIRVRVVIIPPGGMSLLQSVRELSTWLYGVGKLSELNISDDPQIFYQAKVNNSVDISDLLVAGEGEIEFVIPSGRGYKKTTTPVSISGSRMVVTYSGTAPTYPVITWTPSADYNGAVTFTHIETGDVFSLKGLFKSGKKVTIDSSKRKVVVDNDVNMSVIQLSSRWIKLSGYGTHNIVANVTGEFTCTMRENIL